MCSNPSRILKHKLTFPPGQHSPHPLPPPSPGAGRFTRPGMSSLGSESRWQLGQCQLTPSQAGHLSWSHPVPQPAPPLPLSILPLKLGWHPSAHYSLKQKPLALGTYPLPKRSMTIPSFLYSPIKVLIFNSIPGEKEERGFRMRGWGGLSPCQDCIPLLQRLERN